MYALHIVYYVAVAATVQATPLTGQSRRDEAEGGFDHKRKSLIRQAQ